MARNGARTVFLDANVLAAPVARTLLLIGLEAINMIAVWSQQAEDEASRHLRSRAMRFTDEAYQRALTQLVTMNRPGVPGGLC
ncbi:MAG: hypothetical protein QM679_08225 [Patulibacter sp.]